MLNLFSLQRVADIKYCTLYARTNSTHPYHYFCYKNEICCQQGNGCCANRPSKYYESWSFWLFVFGIILAFYLLCWYCKKLEKERQSDRMNHSRSNQNRARTCGMPSARSRPADPNTVDHLLETLIINYRNCLQSSESNSPVPNADQSKTDPLVEPPPKYVEALSMPRPRKRDEKTTGENCAENSIGNASIRSPQDEGIDGEEDRELNRNSFVIVNIIDEQDVPSYEEAKKRI